MCGATISCRSPARWTTTSRSYGHNWNATLTNRAISSPCMAADTNCCRGPTPPTPARQFADIRETYFYRDSARGVMYRATNMKRRFASISLLSMTVLGMAPAQPPAPIAPAYEVDPAWPKALPNQWILGAVAGVAVDAQDHVWIVHRPSTLQPNETRSIWRAAPPVLEFDQAGNLLSSWGGPGTGYEWPDLEHGILVDREHVWLGGGGEKDAQILKFTRAGKFVMQIGRKGQGRGSNDLENLGGVANLTIDREANELYVADGYVNHRVIVFDASSGAYKRHWGAYGKRPDDGYFTQAGEKLPSPFSGTVQHENKPSQYDPDGPPPPQFRIVHSVRIANDGLVYVCDRTNDRLQVFRKDGTFVKEAFIAKRTLGSGSVWDLSFSIDPAQNFLIINDGTNQQI